MQLRVLLMMDFSVIDDVTKDIQLTLLQSKKDQFKGWQKQVLGLGTT